MGPRTRWYDWLLASSAIGLIVVAGLSVDFVPPEKPGTQTYQLIEHSCAPASCELTSGGGHCGCEPVSPPCAMPCVKGGCCPDGCKPVPPLPNAEGE